MGRRTFRPVGQSPESVRYAELRIVGLEQCVVRHVARWVLLLEVLRKLQGTGRHIEGGRAADRIGRFSCYRQSASLIGGE